MNTISNSKTQMNNCLKLLDFLIIYDFIVARMKTELMRSKKNYQRKLSKKTPLNFLIFIWLIS